MISHITNTPLTKRPYGSRTTEPDRVRIHQVFMDADLRFALDGLIKTAKDEGEIDIQEMAAGNLVVFVNTKKDMIKVIACNGTYFPVLSTYRIPAGMPRGSSFDLEIVAEIPKAYLMRGRLDIQEAMKTVLERKLGRVH